MSPNEKGLTEVEARLQAEELNSLFPELSQFRQDLKAREIKLEAIIHAQRIRIKELLADERRMDWLTEQVVEVAIPLRRGSRKVLLESPDEGEDAIGRNRIRQSIDRVMEALNVRQS